LQTDVENTKQGKSANMAGGGYIFLSCCPLPMAMRFGSVKEQTIIGRHPITKHHTALWLLQAEH